MSRRGHLAAGKLLLPCKGIQGTNLGDNSSMLACMKHFAGYGAVIGGRTL